MALLVFKIIFLVVFVIGVLIMVFAQYFFGAKKNIDEKVLNKKITKTKLIGLLVASFGLLLVLILGNF